MDTKKQVIDRLKQANNVLVTVSNDPSVDQLAACIGISLALNKLEKHATAVFSGRVPSTIEFLQPDETIEKNTDSLRDFIISLDKSKADKLRYKVEDQVVRIFITPYRTSISDADLDFSQGDFNVDIVLAIGVQEQKELDQAVTAHGRILHDATVITVNNQEQSGELGSIHWLNTSASSLSEMAAMLALGLDGSVLDEQIATALMTGIVAETGRFSNEKTTAETMNVSASLMAAGANQQLVATKLQEAPVQQSEPGQDSDVESPAHEARVNENGTLEINHDNDKKPTPMPVSELPPKEEKQAAPPLEDVGLPELSPAKSGDTPADEKVNYKNARKVVSPPPFSSDTDPNLANQEETFVDPLSLPPVDTTTPILSHDAANAVSQASIEPRDHSKDTLQDIEKEVNSPHLQAAQSTPSEKPSDTNPEELDLNDLQRPSGLDEQAPEPSVDAARDAVAAAMSDDSSKPLEPISALNATPLGGPLHEDTKPLAPVSEAAQSSIPPVTPAIASPSGPDPSTLPTADQPMTMPLPGQSPAPSQNTPEQSADSSSSAPPVPPPIVPPFPQ
jgi:hypothetical protein